MWVEICLISACGVRGSLPSLWKRQWYAVGWVDPNAKYITKLEYASGNNNANPVWRTKFSFQIDDEPNNNNSSLQEVALNVEVYCRDPVFLTEKLHGSATILLKEFLTKKQQRGHEEVGSYQLRKNKSNKPRGFIDVSVRVCEDKELEPTTSSHLGNDEGGIMLLDRGNKPHMATNGGFGQGYQQQHAQTSVPYPQEVPFPTNYSNPYAGGPSYPAAPGPNYQPPRGPPPHPPPPPSNAGYVPNYFPSNDGGIGPSYFDMPSSSAAAPATRQRGPPPPGFAIGAGAGALAAGAVMFGDGHFMSGFDVPSSGLGGDPTIAIATDPLF